MTSDLYQSREILMVIYIGNIEVILGTDVGWTKINTLQHSSPCIGWFNKEMVVTDEAKNLAIAIDAIFAKHLLDGYLSCAATLVGDILY